LKSIIGKGLLLPLVLLANLAFGNELENNVKFGTLLTEAVQHKKVVKIKKLDQYKEIKSYLSDNKCPGYKYKAYIVGPEGNRNFYLVASKGKNVIIGRHFKAAISSNVIDISTFESSTNGCLNLGPVKSNAASMYATHLKPFPNEFHLLQSNIRRIALYIGTKEGMYVVNNGEIVLSKDE